MQSCNGSHIYCRCVVLFTQSSQEEAVDEAQRSSVDHNSENRGNCELMGNAFLKSPYEEELHCQTVIAMPIKVKTSTREDAAADCCGENLQPHDSLSTITKCDKHLKTTSVKSTSEKVQTVFELSSCECSMPQVDTVVEVSEMTSEVHEEPEPVSTFALISSKVNGILEALGESEREVDLMESKVARLTTQLERLLGEIVSTRAELDEEFPPPENSLADMPPTQTEHLEHWNREGMNGTEQLFEYLGAASASGRCASAASVPCEADEGATIEWSSVEDDYRSESVLVSSSDLLQTQSNGAASNSESGRSSLDYSHPDSSVLFRADINLVLQNLVAIAAREARENPSSVEDDTSSSSESLSCIEGEDVEIHSDRYHSRADLGPTSQAMQSAHDIYTLPAADEHAYPSRPFVPVIDEASEAMRSARSMYNAGDKSGCESESDDNESNNSDGSSISRESSKLQKTEMNLPEEQLSTKEDETDEDVEDDVHVDDHSISVDETKQEEETCFDLDALFDSQRQIVDVEEVAAAQDPSKAETESTTSMKDQPVWEGDPDEVCPTSSPSLELDDDDVSESTTEELDSEMDTDSIFEEFLDMDPATLQCIGDYAEGENDDSPSQNTEITGRAKRRRWLNLRKPRVFPLRRRHSNGGAKVGMKFAKWCRKWAGKKTRKVFRFFTRTGTRREEGQQ